MVTICRTRVRINQRSGPYGELLRVPGHVFDDSVDGASVVLATRRSVSEPASRDTSADGSTPCRVTFAPRPRSPRGRPTRSRARRTSRSTSQLSDRPWLYARGAGPGEAVRDFSAKAVSSGDGGRFRRVAAPRQRPQLSRIVKRSRPAPEPTSPSGRRATYSFPALNSSKAWTLFPASRKMIHRHQDRWTPAPSPAPGDVKFSGGAATVGGFTPAEA